MFKVFIAAFAFLITLSPAICRAAEPSASQPESGLDQTLRVFSNTQIFNFGTSVAFCSRNESEGTKVIEVAFKKYMDNFSSGTKAGLTNVDKSEKIKPPSPALEQGEILEVRTQQRDMLLKAIQTSPTAGCKKLLDIFNASSADQFQRNIESSYGEYQQKRKELCSKADRPTNCN